MRFSQDLPDGPVFEGHFSDTICVAFSKGRARQDCFIQKKKIILYKWSRLADHSKTGKRMVKDHLKTKPFDFRPQIDHSKTGSVWFWDGDCS